MRKKNDKKKLSRTVILSTKEQAERFVNVINNIKNKYSCSEGDAVSEISNFYECVLGEMNEHYKVHRT